MKKSIKISVISFLVLVALWGSLFLVDFSRSKNQHREPLLRIRSCLYDYEDGCMHESMGFGYKYIWCQRGSQEKTVLVPFWVNAQDVYKNLAVDA